MHPLERFLERLQLRSEISSRSRKALLSVEVSFETCPARWDIVRAGQKVESACLVATGLVGRAEQFADGTRRTAAYYVAGDMCDLHSVAISVAGWYIAALTDCEICKVPHKYLLTLFERFPDLSIAFWRDTIADASVSAKWVTLLSGAPARQRLAHLLCEYGVRVQAAGMGTLNSFPFPLTQAQIAEIIGTTSVHVSRVMKQLSLDGILHQRRGAIEVEDLASLERVAEFDRQYLLFRRDPSQLE